MRVILASASPRRRELLSLLLEEFDCCPADVDETPIADELPEDYVLRMAVEKASAVKNKEESSSDRTRWWFYPAIFCKNRPLLRMRGEC